MNKSERQYHEYLKKKYPDANIQTQVSVSFAQEIGMRWDMDFVITLTDGTSWMVDVKGMLRRDTDMKARLWKLLGDRPLEIVKVLPRTGKPLRMKRVLPDKALKLELASRLISEADLL